MIDFKKIIFVTVGTISMPALLLLIPFFIEKESYISLMSLLACAQSILLFSGLGLEISLPKANASTLKIILISFIVTIAISFIIFLISNDKYGDILIYAIIIAYANLLSNIILGDYLYKGDLARYGFVGFLKGLVFILLIYCISQFEISLRFSWVLASVGMIATLLFVRTTDNSAYKYSINNKSKNIIQENFLRLFLSGIPLAFIILIGVAPFTLDKILSRTLFTSSEFAKYSILTTWSVPIIYLANVAFQYLFGTRIILSWKVLLNSIFLIFTLSSTYVITIFLFLKCFSIVPPYFESFDSFLESWFIVVAFYTIFSSLNYPVSAVVFHSHMLNMVAKIMFLLLILYLTIFILLNYFLDLINTNYFGNFYKFMALLFIFSFSMLIPKFLCAYRVLKSNNKTNS